MGNEVFSPIQGYEGHYSVSNYGDIYSHKSGKILKPFLNSDGYYRICLCKNNLKRKYQVHRLVGTAFIDGYFEGAVINHKDYNRTNNYYENLEWLSVQSNHRYSKDTRDKATRKSNSKQYIVTYPCGYTKKITNLTAFCKEHALTRENLSKVARGERKHHKQFKCKIILDKGKLYPYT